MNQGFAATLLALVILLPSTRAAEDDVKFDQFFRNYLEQEFQLRPFAATQLGDHRFDHLLDDLSPEGRQKHLDHILSTLRDLKKQVDYKNLSRPSQIDFEILKHDLETTLWLDQNTRPYETNPRLYNEYISDSVFLLLVQSRLPKETNIANAISRMGQVPRIVEAAKRNLKNPPRAVLETAMRQNQGSIAFYEKDIFEVAGETGQKEQLHAAAARLVPVLKDYQEFLEKDLLPRATGDWRLGKSKFVHKLDLELDAGISADQVLRDAEEEFQRVREAMYVISCQLWSRYYPEKPLPPLDAPGRRATIEMAVAAVSQEHGQPDQLVQDGRATIERIKSFIRDRHILRLPEPDRCQVIEMPAFQRGNSLAYLDAAPPLDPDAPSFYAISPPLPDWNPKRIKTLLEEYNRYLLQILTIHEGYPGHYVQLEYSNRSGSLIRRVLQSGPYVEGWAVYTEKTMLDQGYGDGDSRLRLMQLKFYLRAVGNAIIDHKMHCGEMTDEQVLLFLVNDAFQSEEEARQKIVRAKQTSCQLSTYFVGRMAMQRLRDEMERKLGDKFNLAQYHEALLNQGSVPVKYLPELVGTALQP
jgi:uncharacterized protein (DUF885 family)